MLLSTYRCENSCAQGSLAFSKVHGSGFVQYELWRHLGPCDVSRLHGRGNRQNSLNAPTYHLRCQFGVLSDKLSCQSLFKLVLRQSCVTQAGLRLRMLLRLALNSHPLYLHPTMVDIKHVPPAQHFCHVWEGFLRVYAQGNVLALTLFSLSGKCQRYKGSKVCACHRRTNNRHHNPPTVTAPLTHSPPLVVAILGSTWTTGSFLHHMRECGAWHFLLTSFTNLGRNF